MQTNPLIKQGWLRALLYFVGLFLIVLAAPLLCSPLIDQITADKQLSFALNYTAIAVFVLLFTWLMKKFVDRQHFITLGFQWKNYSTDAGIGIGTALAMLGIGTLLLILHKDIAFTGYAADPSPLLIQLALMLVVAFSEEIMFRGYILYNLMCSTNKWIALFISALLFAAVHATNPGVAILPVINVFLAGLLLGANYIFSRNLWFSIMFHFAWNFTQGPILGYEVSGVETNSLLQQSNNGNELWTGGKFGFEGSILCTALLLIFTLIWLTLFSRKYEGNKLSLAQ